MKNPDAKPGQPQYLGCTVGFVDKRYHTLLTASSCGENGTEVVDEYGRPIGVMSRIYNNDEARKNPWEAGSDEDLRRLATDIAEIRLYSDVRLGNNHYSGNTLAEVDPATWKGKEVCFKAAQTESESCGTVTYASNHYSGTMIFGVDANTSGVVTGAGVYLPGSGLVGVAARLGEWEGKTIAVFVRIPTTDNEPEVDDTAAPLPDDPQRLEVPELPTWDYAAALTTIPDRSEGKPLPLSQGEFVYIKHATPAEDGTMWSQCTVAFADKTRGVAVTAAHCGESGSVVYDTALHPLGVLQRLYSNDEPKDNHWEHGSAGDWLRMATDLAVIRPYADVVVGANPFSGDTHAGITPDELVGKQACVYGSTTQEVRCGTIVYRGKYYADQIFGVNVEAAPGDSGGPVWIPGDGVVGSIHAGSSQFGENLTLFTRLP
ncbi:hypothetical protein ACFPVT_06440 [Corynebacterium choanae]|nr:hypothetical protein [Corynebacterium choanae]